MSEAEHSPVTQAGWTWRPMGWGASYGTVGPPALATHRGELWLLYRKNLSEQLQYYAHGTTTGQWKSPKKLDNEPTATGPGLTDLNGTLHAMTVSDSPNHRYQLWHYIYDDANDAWQVQSGLSYGSKNAPALTAYHDHLYCVFTSHLNNTLMYLVFSPQHGWTSPAKTCNNERSGAKPAMFVTGNRLYAVFTSDNDKKEVIQLFYDEKQDSWSRYTASAVKEAADDGVSAAGLPDRAFIGFQKRGGKALLVSTFVDGSWSGNEQVGQSSWDTPGLAVQSGLLNCVYSSTAEDLRQMWLAQRPDYATVNVSHWMSSLSSDKLLSRLSIPGTHDSCAVSYVPMVGCQAMSIRAQLEAGIRMFDLRCGLVFNELYMFHGSYMLDPPFGLKLSDVLTDIYTWLAEPAHVKEAVITSIKEDHDPVESSISFSSAVRFLINQGPCTRWWLHDAVPMLGDVRNKLVLLRRYHDDGTEPMGIDLTAWQDNKPSFEIKTPTGVLFTVQDEYDPGGITVEQLVQRKWSVVAPMLDLAAADTTSRWYLNFSSAVGDTAPFFVEPGEIAYGVNYPWIHEPGVNYYLAGKLRSPATKRYGTILMDFPERPAPSDLIHSIVMSNL